MFENILICVDGSDIAQRAVQVGAEISAKFGSNLHILTVVRPYRVSPELKRFLQAENLMGEPKYVLDDMTKGIIADGRKMAEDAGGHPHLPDVFQDWGAESGFGGDLGLQ